jgi:hypothetical protein
MKPFNFQWRGGDRQVDAVLAGIDYRIVLNFQCGDLEVARTARTGFVGEAFRQNQRIFSAKVA